MPGSDVERMQRSRKDEPQMVPQPIQGEPDLVQVDTTWGELQPLQAAEGVRTVGELELVEHLQRGEPVVDSRTAAFHAEATLPGAHNIPFPEAAERVDELDKSKYSPFHGLKGEYLRRKQAGVVRAVLHNGANSHRVT